MRKAFSISETTFTTESGLVQELVNYVVEILGPVYAEMEKNIKQVINFINGKLEIIQSLLGEANHRLRRRFI